ncbi:MAG: dihydroorotase [Thermoplasmatota archaeon]
MTTYAGRIYQNGELVPGVLHVEDGRITQIAPPGPADVDFGDKAILPGAIDIHVHFRDPGATHKEDWQTGTTAAAFGGVTAVVDMPNTAPPTTTMKALKEKLSLAQEKAVVDYAAWCGATWYLDDLPEMLNYTPGIKIYLGATTGDLLAEDGNRVKEAIRICGEAGKPVLLHCEAQRVLDQYRRTEQKLEDHHTTRPPLAEVEAIYDIMKALPGMKKIPLVHVCHIASADAVRAAQAAKFSRGVCPHHILLDHVGCCDHNPGKGKMNPPLRDPAARQALWQAFADGHIPILESDHAPHTKTEKAEDFHKVPAGVPGVETLLPVMLAKAVAGEVSFPLVVEAATRAPADLLGLSDRGRLEVGARADFAVYDLVPQPIDESKLHSKCGWSPFDGMDAIMPSHTYLAGEAIVADGTLLAKPGSGQPLFPLP